MRCPSYRWNAGRHPVEQLVWVASGVLHPGDNHGQVTGCQYHARCRLGRPHLPIPYRTLRSLTVAHAPGGPEIARPMRALTRLVLPASALTTAPLVAQEASPYVSLGHWTMPYVEHLIARGVRRDPTSLTRTLKRADLV